MMQASALQARQQSKEKEVEALRRQILDYQVIGCCFLNFIELRRVIMNFSCSVHLVALQVSNFYEADNWPLSLSSIAILSILEW